MATQLASLAQIRAARALLNWTQADLAKASKLSLTAINKFEREAGNPRLNTLRKIQDAFEQNGVEFQDGPGLRLRGEIFTFTMLDRGDVIADLFDDVVTTCLAQNLPGGNYMNVRETDFAASGLEASKHLARRLRQFNLHDRVLVEEGDNYLMFPPDTTRYRWLPKILFGITSFIVYGTKFAILLWGPPVRATIIENPSVAAAYAKQFEFFWNQSKEPPFKEKDLHALSAKLLPLD